MAADVNVILRDALRQLEARRTRLDLQLAALRTALDGAGTVSSSRPRIRRRKPLTAAARQAISRRMKAYWAKKRGARG